MIGSIEKMMHWGGRLRTRLYTALLASQFKDFGRGSRITPPFRYFGLSMMSLGENVMINRDCWIQVVPQHAEKDVTPLVIQSHAGIGMGAQISAARQVTIGEYALLGRNVYISDHAHAFRDINRPIMHQGIDTIAPVVIGRSAWIGQNVVILPGVTIGQHCVIGANSVVNESIPDYSIAVGAPARVVKKYRPETQQWEPV